MAPEAVESKTHEQISKSRSADIPILETFMGDFLDLAQSEGLSLLEVEFNKKKIKVLPDGRTQETTIPITVTPAIKIGRDRWGVKRQYLLDGDDATYYIEFDNFSTEDGHDNFLGITKTSPLNRAKNKAEWRDVLLERKAPYYDRNKILLPSVSVTFSGGFVAYARIRGEKDDLLEKFYQNLKRHSPTK